MRILFAGQDPHIPHLVAGAAMDVHHLALAFAAMGHECAVVAALPGLAQSVTVRQLPYRVRQATDRKHLLVFRDSDNGYETFRVGHWLVPRLVDERITRWRPDVLVVQGNDGWGLALVAVAHGLPVIMRHVDAFGIDRLAEAAACDTGVASLLTNPLVMLACNSLFTVGRAKHHFGYAPPVIYPPISAEDPVNRDAAPKYVTFVSPVPAKGLSIALRASAMLPDREFLFVHGHATRSRQRRDLYREVARLPNVTLRASSVGLGDVYRSTALILMPSQVHEAFGRVIVEAGQYGIPALASRIGGIPESIGESGVMLAASDPPECWASTISQVLSDPEAYARLSAGALANAQRDEFSAPSVAARFLGIVEDHLAGAAR